MHERGSFRSHRPWRDGHGARENAAERRAERAAAATASKAHGAELLTLPDAEDVRIFATPAEMYQSGLIDAVLIATPHRLHVRQAVEAFRAGMHVLLEKPTGVSTQEVRLLNAEADRSGRARCSTSAPTRLIAE